jgi:hypothetical protein
MSENARRSESKKLVKPARIRRKPKRHIESSYHPQNRTPTPGIGTPHLAETEHTANSETAPGVIMDLQRTVGNQATIRMLQRNTGWIQREASIADRLNKAMDGWGSDEGKILQITARASDEDKQAVLNNPRLVKRLTSELSRRAMLIVLKNLNAPLAQRLRMAMDGWGTDEQTIIQITRDADDTQRKDLLKDTALLKRLKGELSRGQMLTVLANLHAPLADRINAAMDGWGVDANTILQITRNADETQKKDLLKDTALISRLKGEFNRDQMLVVLANLYAPLADRLNVAMDGWGADEKTILQITKNASDIQKKDLLKDTTLISRLKSETSRTVMINVLKNLKAPLADRINVALEGWGSDEEAVVAILTHASNADFTVLLADTAMIARLSEMPEVINNPALSNRFVKAMAKPAVDIDKSLAVFILADSYSDYTTITGGNVKMLSQADFEKAWDDIYGKDDFKNNVVPAHGNLEGFAHNGVNYINQGNTSVDTVPHEMLHNNTSRAWYSFVSPADNDINNVTEGTTEYLTIKAVTAAGYTPSHSYPNQESVIQVLIGVIGEEMLKRGYFKGETDPIKKTVNYRCKGSWSGFLKQMKKSDWAKAKLQLRPKTP